MDLFKLTCLKCGHSFGLSSDELYEARTCFCPQCGQKMGSWEFYDLKSKYYRCLETQKKVFSGLGINIPDPRFFKIEMAGDETELEDVRLLKYILSIYEEERDKYENSR